MQIKEKYWLYGILLLAAVMVLIIYDRMNTLPEFPPIEACEQLYRESYNMSAKAECYTEAAIAQKNPEICGYRYLDTWRQSDCIKAVIAAAPEDPEVYEKLRNPQLRAVFIYHRLNLSLEEFNPTYGVDEYLLDTIRGKTNISLNVSIKHMFICNEIDNIVLRDKCYRQIATIEKNTTICNIITVPLEKDHCYRNIALETHDYVFCDGIIDILLRTDCYSEAATYNKNASICDKIEIPERRGMCYHDTGGGQ